MNGYVIILFYTFNTVSSVINLERRTFSRYILLVEFEKKKKQDSTGGRKEAKWKVWVWLLKWLKAQENFTGQHVHMSM